jgi:hypothetical protein
MLDRRAFLTLVVLGVAAAGTVHAGTVPTKGPRAATAVSAPQPAPSPEFSRRAWNTVVSTYRAMLGLGVMQLMISPDPPMIEGIQDGPDGVDPLGVKGIKGLTPKYQDDQPPPVQ